MAVDAVVGDGSTIFAQFEAVENTAPGYTKWHRN